MKKPNQPFPKPVHTALQVPSRLKLGVYHGDNIDLGQGMANQCL